MSVLTPSARRLRRVSPLGLLEALATPHGVDRYLELVHPMLTVRELRASVTAVHRPAPDTVRLTLRPTRQWRGFQAGQFVQVSVDVDGVRRTRCFSPCSSQHRPDGRIELTVKAHADGVVSRYLYDHAAPGLVVGLSQADGRFSLPPSRPERILLISGGSGITPVLSMLRTLCDEGYAGDVTFLHYADTPAHVSHRDELHELAGRHPNVRLVFGYARADGDLRGRFDDGHLASAAAWYRDAETFLCGPAGLMASVRETYDRLGLTDRLHVEEFTPPVVVGAGTATGTLRFARSAIDVPNSGSTLLEQAEAAGLDPEHGCRMGICFSCTQVKRSGCTRNVLTGDTHTEADEEIQLCISVPVGDVELDL